MNLIDRLKELEAKATPGPWFVDPCGDIWSKDRSLIVMRDGQDGSVATTSYWTERNPNGELMAEMRNALPKLLAVVEAAEKFVYEPGPISGYLQLLKSALATLDEVPG